MLGHAPMPGLGPLLTDVRSKPPVINLSSSYSASGKTNLLYLLVASIVLPTPCNGKEQAIAWIDADGRFSAARLYTVLSNHLSKSEGEEKDAILSEALKHIHVFRPQSSLQVLVTLRELPEYLLGSSDLPPQLAKHPSINRSLGLLVVDSATAFYWQDRSDAELARLESFERGSSSATAPRPPKAADVISTLKQLQSFFDCTVIYTSTSSSSSSMTATARPPSSHSAAHATTAPSIHGPLRLSPWAASATLNLQMSRVSVPQFVAHMGLETCRREQTARLKAAQAGRFAVALDWGLAETWAPSVREAVARVSGGMGGFGVRITGEGVALEEAQGIESLE